MEIVCLNVWLLFMVSENLLVVSGYNAAYVAPSSGKVQGGVVVPWSEYRRRKYASREPKIQINAPSSRPSESVILYLPAYHQQRVMLSDKQSAPENMPNNTKQLENFDLRLTQKFPTQISRSYSTATARHDIFNDKSNSTIQFKYPLRQSSSHSQNDQFNYASKNLFPTNYNSIRTSDKNVVNSIFSQSQNQPLSARNDATPPFFINDLFSTARDSPVEQIARFAKNLLSHENQQLIAAVTNAISNNKKGGLFTSLATSNAEDHDVVFNEMEQASSLNSRNESDYNTSSYIPIMSSANNNDTTEEEVKLLAAAIKNNELAPASLMALHNDTQINKTNLESIKKEQLIRENKALNYIQEHRNLSLTFKKNRNYLPYYGRYCGLLAEMVNSTKNYEITGRVWMVDNKRFIISNFHFKPSSTSDNITFWVGPMNLSMDYGSASFPNDNGIYLQPEPLDVNIFELKPTISCSSQPRQIRNIKAEYSANLEQVSIKNNLTSGLCDGLNSTFPNNVHQIQHFNKGFNQTQLAADVMSLDWSAGDQPLLLRLPNELTVQNIRWISIYDHNIHSPLAVSLIPSGFDFTVPSTVQLRGFKSNGAYKVSSGPIVVNDIKTITIVNFSLQTEGIPVWFMVGKEMLPSKNGHIIPVRDQHAEYFDCSSLRDYQSEDVHLRLPNNLVINDIFWFAIYSLNQEISFSQIYLPYNDMHLPPDLDGNSVPTCTW